MNRPGAHAATVPAAAGAAPAAREPAPGGRRRALRIALFVAGLAVLAAILGAVGLEVDRGEPRADRLAGSPALVALYALAQLAFALGWWVLIGRRPAARSASASSSRPTSAATRSTTSRASAGEPVKAQLLKDRMGFSRALATVTVHRHADVLAQWLFLTAGRGLRADLVSACRRSRASRRSRA